MPDDLNSEPPVIGGRGHKSTCECKTCQRIREMHSRGQAKPPDKRRLGPRQVRRRVFVKAYTDPLSPTFGNQGKSAQSAGFAASTGNSLLNDSQVQNMVRAALERHGIDEDFLAEGLKEGLRAEEVKLASFDGKYTDEKRVPDWHARVRYQEMAHRLRGDYPKEEIAQNAVIVLHVPPAVPMVEGHDAHCSCNECIEEYNRRAEKFRLHAPEPNDE